jgi:hypothetical protein
MLEAEMTGKMGRMIWSLALVFAIGMGATILLNWVGPGMPIFYTASTSIFVLALVVLTATAVAGAVATAVVRPRHVIAWIIVCFLATYVGAVVGAWGLSELSSGTSIAASGGFAHFMSPPIEQPSGASALADGYRELVVTWASLGTVPDNGENDVSFPNPYFWLVPSVWELVGCGFGVLTSSTVFLVRKRQIVL